MDCAKLLITLLLCVASAYAVNIGASCVNHEACTPENSHCMPQYQGCENGRCMCDQDYYRRSDTECRMALMIEDPCTDGAVGTADCVAGTMGSACDNEVCACPANRPNVETVNGVSYCYGSLFGGPCEDHVECLTRSTSGTLGICHDTEKTCTCEDRAKRDGETCRLASHGEECVNNGVQCDDDLTCTDNTCACPASEKWHEGRCVDDEAVAVAVGEVCDQNDLTAEAAVCDAGQFCDRCPEDATSVDTTCKLPAGGASGLTATITSVLSAATVVTLKLFV